MLAIKLHEVTKLIITHIRRESVWGQLRLINQNTHSSEIEKWRKKKEKQYASCTRMATV